MQDLAGKVAVVTGGGSGIGQAMARRFGIEGMKVVVADIERPALQRTADALVDEGVDVLAVPTDVSLEHDVRALAAATLDHFGDELRHIGRGAPGRWRGCKARELSRDLAQQPDLSQD